MRPNGQALESSPLSPWASTATARPARDLWRPLHVKPAHLLLLLLAATCTAIALLPGGGTNAHASCGAAALMAEFACADGQVPDSHPGRTCVSDSSLYGTTFWRCANRESPLLRLRSR